MIDEAEIHRMANSADARERRKAAELLHDFTAISDKNMAWDDLHRLTYDKDTSVRVGAAHALGPAFFYIPDKNAAWEDVIRLMQDEAETVRVNLVFLLGPAFFYVPDKNAAWKGLHKLMQTGIFRIQMNVIHVLELAFLYVPDKKAMWDDLITFAYDNIFMDTIGKLLGQIFSHLPDKETAWEDLHRLNEAENVFVQIHGTYALGLAFSHIPDKKAAWNDLHRLNETDDVFVREAAASVLGSAFAHVLDKEAAWEDLHKLTEDKYVGVRRNAASALGFAYPHVPDKNAAWEDLHRLNEDKNINVRMRAVSALRLAFVHIFDENAAWNDLHKFTEDGLNVRSFATSAIGQVFLHLPDKKVAWDDLHRLTMDEEKGVRRNAAIALGEAFQYVPDKNAAWEDLQRLADDGDRDVRMYAYHSLGSASVYKAIETEDEEKFKDEFKRAINYFEKSSQEATHIFLNPTFFCLPFYRSYYAVISRQQGAEAAATKYIDVAKSAVVGSESREILLKAVENLANALKEAQKPDFHETKEHLRACRQYCDHTAELADSTRDKTPVATAAIMRGIPIVGVKIKEIIAEIQEKAEALCKQTKGTPLEPLGLETHEKAKQLSPDNVSSFDWFSATTLKLCEHLPLEKRATIYKKILTVRHLDDITEKSNIMREILDDISKDIDTPRLNYIHISETKKNLVSIATVQLNFQLTDSFPPTLVERDATKKKILSALEIAKNEGAEIACLPELCIHEEWVEEIGNQFSDMIIIPGSYYDSNNYNTCKLSLESDISIQPQRKITPSAFEDSRVMGPRMTCGEKIINIYQTQFGSFAILICRDFGNFIHFLRGKVDIVFVPSYNPANARFHKDADSHITNSPSYVIISNTALYGGTSIFGQLDFKHFNALEQGECKKKGDSSYKLCEIEKDEEGLIIADFNLIYKSPQKQNPINPDEEIISVENIRKIYL